MLRDHHIQELAGQLRSVDQENRQHHENLSNLLQNFLPPDEDWLVYNRRAKQHKLCNGYHLGGECGNLSCEFDHSEVDDTSLAAMR